MALLCFVFLFGFHNSQKTLGRSIPQPISPELSQISQSLSLGYTPTPNDTKLISQHSFARHWEQAGLNAN